MANQSPPPVLPQAPVDLLAVAVGGCEVILAWTECGAGGLGFRIERADGIGSARRFSEIGEVGPHVAAFRDGSVKLHTTYSYRVHAWNASGDSSPSNVTRVTTPRAEMELQYD
ncbi:hypothetical protein [Candidatus Deferrimicrobium sp.]|uniref:hypothetical protein n=1 Tax=Candidatus Deferrimicrobium sp. TaxID=3060586 RepID=UPI003C3E1A14